MKQLSIEELNASGNLTGIKLGGTSSDNELLIRSIINGLIDAGVVVAKDYTDSQVMQDAPKDGKAYGRRNGEWVRVELYPFEMLVTSPTLPTLIDVEGGTITTVDNGDGTFTFESVDNITHFKFDANKEDITKVEILFETLTDLSLTFLGLSSMTEFITIPTAFNNVTDAQNAWNGCYSLASFPIIDFSNVASVFNAWLGCSSLTSFPLIDFSNTIYLNSAWFGCSGLLSFSSLNFSSVTNGTDAFNNCTALTQPPPTGTAVRDGDNATQGIWNIT